MPDLIFRVVLVRPDGDRSIWHNISDDYQSAREAAEHLAADESNPPGTRVESVMRDFEEEERVRNVIAEEGLPPDDEDDDFPW